VGGDLGRPHQTINLIKVAFTSHYNAPRFFQEFRRGRSRKDVLKEFRWAVVIAFGIALLFYMIIGILGYIAFCQEGVDGNILNNIVLKASKNAPNNGQTFIPDWMVPINMIAHAWMLFSAVVGLPQAFHAARRSIFNVLTLSGGEKWLRSTKLFAAAPTVAENHNNEVEEPVLAPLRKDTRAWWFFSTILLVFMMVLGILLRDIKIFNGVRGCTLNTMMVYVFPALMILRLMFSNKNGNDEENPAAIPDISKDNETTKEPSTIKKYSTNFVMWFGIMSGAVGILKYVLVASGVEEFKTPVYRATEM